MATAIAVVVMIAFLAGWNTLLYKRPAGQRLTPLSMAVTATFAALFFIVSGGIGYTLSKHDRFVAHTAWTDGVIWSQVWVGLTVAAFAVVLWRRALRSIRSGGGTASA